MRKHTAKMRILCAGLSLTMLLLCTACTSSGKTTEGRAADTQTAQQTERASHGTVTEENPIVSTKYGKVQGRTEDGVAGFRNIPYGSNVDGEQRFLPATEPDSWDDIKDCTVTGSRAVQTVGLSGHGNLFQTRVGDYFAGGRIGELGLND